ncbi:CrcB protein [Actinopolyspora lacussalsi subsp. righensis]|uniref:Fluoride-specific ion channel FluC n=1 Tax=Actinopolyspora righensis TaxID=995060 RepID=A0A1I7C0H7_9ACTN|nr:CrcB family protein [Actinopolyspora righensis]SFT92933.1 CrcB protein [Actinopolyspora righensis]
MTLLLVALGGAAGAVLRYGIDLGVRRGPGSVFPWGTFTVNVVGSFLIALLAGGAAVFDGFGSPGLRTLLVVGLCGALTTFSTFGQDTVRLYTSGARSHAARYVLGTVLGGVAAAGLGLGTVALFARL